jgi:branched-chain amino acid transport system permease protein
LTAFVGAVIFLQKIRISPDAAFSVNDRIALAIFIVVIGGIGSLAGPIPGTLLFFALRETPAALRAVCRIVPGIVAIAVMPVAPQGLWGLLRDRAGLRLVPPVHRIAKKHGKGG